MCKGLPFFLLQRVFTFDIKRLGCSDSPSYTSLTPATAEAAGERPAKTGAPPKFKEKQLELDGTHSADSFPFIIFLNSFYYIILLYFYLFSNFSDPINVT